jgi:beta-glucanase (GH16 family)
MEAVNLGTVSDAPDAVPGSIETRVHGTLHYGGRSPDNVHAGSSYRLPDGVNPADGFHVYALEWEHGEIRWYVDGVHYATQRAEHWYSQPSSDAALPAAADAPFDAGARFHLLLNLAVGGNWAGNANAGGIDAAVFPQTLQVDYVRVYQCSADPVTGKGCASIGADAVVVRPERTGQFPVLP